MPADFTYYCSVLGKGTDASRDGYRYHPATPEAANAKSTINNFGLTGIPLKSRTLKGVLALLEKATGVKLSYSRVYREVVEAGVSASVLPAWEKLRHHYQPMDVAVVLVSRAVAT
jgi:hypothetical protein